ncbi:MAG TPA: homoserine kinase [Micromonosporaceae bacterium]|jgi:homoserine kinase|nr:homoserine kinase [Micromonosporaceae bacterium]
MSSPRYTDSVVRVRVPATSANLGPGYDSLGLALDLYDEIEVRLAPSGIAVEVAGEGAGEVPHNQDHLVVRAMRHAFGHLGGQPAGLVVRCRNQIPHGRGLGSSAAAIVGGIVAARALAGEDDAVLDEAAVLRLASGMEGHPDNVAPCLLGGFTIAWTEQDGAHAVRLNPVPQLAPVAFISDGRGLTTEARGLLPDRVPHSDAAANVARAALLVHALTANPSLLLAATEDWLHQDYRAPAMEHSIALVRHLRAAGVPAVVSGAGPSVLALTAPGEDLTGLAAPGFRIRTLRVCSDGATVSFG